MKITTAILVLLVSAATAFADETCPAGEVYSEEQEVCVAERQS